MVTRDAACFTDSVNAVLYKIPFGHGGRLPAQAVALPYSGDLVYGAGFNVNGIEASSDGRTLLVVQSNTGLLFAVDPNTGLTSQVDLGGVSVVNGDGLLRHGRTLYVVQNQLNQIAAFRLDRTYTSARLADVITSPNFDSPTTVTSIGSSLYAVNARFNTPPTPTTPHTVVRVPIH